MYIGFVAYNYSETYSHYSVAGDNQGNQIYTLTGSGGPLLLINLVSSLAYQNIFNKHFSWLFVKEKK